MEGQGDQDELYPIAVLIDELKVSDSHVDWNANVDAVNSTMMFSYD